MQSFFLSPMLVLRKNPLSLINAPVSRRRPVLSPPWRRCSALAYHLGHHNSARLYRELELLMLNIYLPLFISVVINSATIFVVLRFPHHSTSHWVFV